MFFEKTVPTRTLNRILMQCFIRIDGTFAVLRPDAQHIAPKHAIYSSIEAYNNRSERPIYLSAEEATDGLLKECLIDLETLTATAPI